MTDIDVSIQDATGEDVLRRIAAMVQVEHKIDGPAVLSLRVDHFGVGINDTQMHAAVVSERDNARKTASFAIEQLDAERAKTKSMQTIIDSFSEGQAEAVAMREALQAIHDLFEDPDAKGRMTKLRELTAPFVTVSVAPDTDQG